MEVGIPEPFRTAYNWQTGSRSCLHAGAADQNWRTSFQRAEVSFEPRPRCPGAILIPSAAGTFSRIQLVFIEQLLWAKYYAGY